jgi:hypothetical protein
MNTNACMFQYNVKILTNFPQPAHRSKSMSTVEQRCRVENRMNVKRPLYGARGLRGGGNARKAP